MRILVVEDDPRTRSLLADGLAESSHECVQASNGEEALAMLGKAPAGFDLVLLDVMMPVCDGWQMLERLKDSGNRTPVIVLTARHEVHERVQGLRMGADDYLIKPFAWSELLARIDAVGRRTQNVLRCGDVEIDLEGHYVRCGTKRIELSPREFALLVRLAREPGRLVTRKQLLTEVWGIDFEPGTNLIDVTVSRVRRRLTCSQRMTITAVPSHGYVLDVQREPATGGT